MTVARSLWNAVTAFETLLGAYARARAGKRHRNAVASFALRLEEELLDLQRELVERTYRPAPHRVFTIYERKPRLIAAPAFRDRVVHHALMAVIGESLDSGMHPRSFACRVGKGVHAAVNAYQRAARRFAYVLKLDVRQYFPSVSHAILRRQLRARIADDDVLWLVDRILEETPPPSASYPVEPGRGLPIGNLTSQVFANVYLTDFDFWISAQPACGAYLRYVDDLFVFCDDKAALWALCDEARRELRESVALELHPTKLHCRRTSEKVDVLGYQVSRGRRWLRADNGYAFRRRLRKMAGSFARGAAGLEDFRPSVQAWIGHAAHGETEGLRRAIFDAVDFRRASAQ